jgi:tight adherence protein B
VLERFADALRTQEEAAAERAAVLAGPRATAAVLGLLPLAGVGLGLLVGADPLATLVGTAAGRACLLAGGVLWGAGLWWTARMVASAAAAGTA